MAGLNRVILVGRVVRDPELKKTASGISVTSFTIAIDNPTKAGGEKTASFIPCTCWNKTAEIVAKYCLKGTLIGVEGRINQRNYEDKDGSKKSIVDVIVETVQFLDKKKNSADDVDDDPTDDSIVSHEGIDATSDDMPF